MASLRWSVVGRLAVVVLAAVCAHGLLSSGAAQGVASVTLDPNRTYWAVQISPVGSATLSTLVPQLLAMYNAPADVKPKTEFHSTLLWMGTNRSQEGPLIALLGTETWLHVYRVVLTDRLACAAVQIVNPKVRAQSHDEFSHITLALGPHVPAVDSNYVLEMVANGTAESWWKILDGFPFHRDLMVNGTVQDLSG